MNIQREGDRDTHMDTEVEIERVHDLRTVNRGNSYTSLFKNGQRKRRKSLTLTRSRVIDRWIENQIDRDIDGQKDRDIYGQKDRDRDGQKEEIEMDRKIQIQMDRKIDGDK